MKLVILFRVRHSKTINKKLILFLNIKTKIHNKITIRTVRLVRL